MLAHTIRTLYGYNRWATDRVLEAAARLSLEQLHAPGVAGHGSVRDTLVHLLETQKGWLSWWDGTLPPDEAYALKLDPDRLPDVDALRTEWAAIADRTAAFLEGLTDEAAARVWSYTLPNGFEFRMALWQMLLHVANHGTQHRSETAAMLTGHEQSPGDLDLLHYCLASGGEPPG